MTQSWSALPVGSVVYLQGVSAEAVELSMEPLPPDAPALVTFHPAPERRTSRMVESILAELERVAVQLFPAWLPSAEYLEGSGGGGKAAVRALAMERAATTPHFGPFLADLAQGALAGGGHMITRFAPEVRAAELAKVIAASYQRDTSAILVDVPEKFDLGSQRVLGAACDWLARHGGFGVWIAGQQPLTESPLATLRYQLPDHVAEILDDIAVETLPQQRPGAISYPPVAGRPRSDSAAEMALEAALSTAPWATGRVWNRAYTPRPQYVIDLLWAAEGCAIEVDGDDHRGRLKFANDHRRDVLLQLDGVAVLRFTNHQVLDEIDYVVSHIEKFIDGKRTNSQGTI